MSLLVPMDCARNDHMQLVEARLGEIAPTSTEPRRDIRYVFLCFTNRCGSNLLANALSSSGLLNRAEEFFNGNTIVDNCLMHNLTSVPDYFNSLTRGGSKNGLLISKLSYSHLEILAKAGILDRIVGLSRFLMVERIDKLAQAISYDLALQTGQWTHYMPSRRCEGELEYSYARITQHIDSVLDQHRRLYQFFALNGIIPSVVLYERFIQDPAHQIRLLGQYIGLPDLCYVPENVDLRRQTGHINREWREQFVKESRELANAAATGSAAHQVLPAASAVTRPTAKVGVDVALP
jgi:LPS sulfotransferase NodH